MAENKTKSIAEILAAARAEKGGEASAEVAASPQPTQAPATAAAAPQAAAAKPAAAKPAAGGRPSVADIMAQARAKKAAGTAEAPEPVAKPAAAATPAAAAKPAAAGAKPVAAWGPLRAAWRGDRAWAPAQALDPLFFALARWRCPARPCLPAITRLVCESGTRPPIPCCELPLRLRPIAPAALPLPHSHVHLPHLWGELTCSL